MLDYIKEHPILSGLLALLLVALFFILRRSTSSTSAGTQVIGSTGPDDTIQAQEIQAGAQLQAYQVQAQVSAIQSSAQLQAAALAANVSNTQTAAQQDVTNKQTQAQLTLGLADEGQSTSSILQLLAGQVNPFAAFYLAPGVANTPGGGGSAATGTPPPSNNTPAPSNYTPTPTQPFPFTNAPGSLNNLADTLASQAGEADMVPATTGIDALGHNFTSCPSGYDWQNGMCVNAASNPSAAVDLANQIATFGQFQTPIQAAPSSQPASQPTYSYMPPLPSSAGQRAPATGSGRGEIGAAD